MIVKQKNFFESNHNDDIDSYFECVTACSLEDKGIECITECIEVHLKKELS